MSLWQAAILALVQAATEFLPVSSSAHLVLVRWLLGWPDPGLAFDVALHFGTLLALTAYFFRTWVAIAAAAISRRLATALADRSGSPLHHRPALLWHLALATVPAGLAGLLGGEIVEDHLRTPVVIGVMLVVVGLVLLWADRRGGQGRDLDALSLRSLLVIGCAQAVALVPGTSRSGITIAAGLFLGLRRNAAARLSFLLAMPIVLGASLKAGADLLPASILAPPEFRPLLVGIAVSAVAGYLVIASFLRYLQTSTLAPFVYYRLAFGTIVLALVARTTLFGSSGLAG